MRARAAVALGVLWLVAGCGGGGGSETGDPAKTAVSGAVYSAAGAVARGDARDACRRLTGRARRELERRARTGCGAAVRKLAQRLPGPGVAALQRLVVRSVRVHGARAAAVAEPPPDLLELARATGVTYPLSARVRLVRAHGRWLIDDASAARR